MNRDLCNDHCNARRLDESLHEYVRTSRRQFFGRGWPAVGRGGARPRCSADSAAIGRKTGTSRHAETALRRQGEARHLSAHGRRAAADGPVRLQAEDAASGTTRTCPTSIRMGQRLTTMTSGQERFPIAPSKYKFAQHGKCGMWVSELLPYTAKMVDDMCFIRSMHTEAINHEPAITLHADRQPDHRPAVPGRVGVATAWARSTRTCRRSSCWSPSRPTPSRCRRSPARLWQAGYLPGEHAGVSFRAGGDPILYINNPPGVLDRGPPQDARRPQAAQRDELQAGRRPGDAHAHPAVRDWRSACRRACRN